MLCIAMHDVKYRQGNTLKRFDFCSYGNPFFFAIFQYFVDTDDVVCALHIDDDK